MFGTNSYLLVRPFLRQQEYSAHKARHRPAVRRGPPFLPFRALHQFRQESRWRRASQDGGKINRGAGGEYSCFVFSTDFAQARRNKAQRASHKVLTQAGTPPAYASPSKRRMARPPSQSHSRRSQIARKVPSAKAKSASSFKSKSANGSIAPSEEKSIVSSLSPC